MEENIKELSEPPISYEQFQLLVAKWTDDTMVFSTWRQISDHPVCQEIIKMGKSIIPFIMSDLQEKLTNHWFGVLTSITGESPVPKQDRGKILKMREAWLEWGRIKGYLKEK